MTDLRAELVKKLLARADQLCGPDAGETITLLREAAATLTSHGGGGVPYLLCNDGTIIPGWIIADMQSIAAWFKANGRADWHVAGIGPLPQPRGEGVEYRRGYEDGVRSIQSSPYYDNSADTLAAAPGEGSGEQCYCPRCHPLGDHRQCLHEQSDTPPPASQSAPSDGGGELPELPMHKGFLLLHNTGGISQVWGYTAEQMHERDRMWQARLEDARRLATAGQEKKIDPSWSLSDRVEFALRDAGFDYDEAFRIAQLAASGQGEAVDREVRIRRRFYFQHNPPNTMLAQIFNDILIANGTFERDTEAHRRREESAAAPTPEQQP